MVRRQILDTCASLDLIIPGKTSGFLHCWRKSPDEPWTWPKDFIAEDIGQVSCLCSMVSIFNDHPHLEVICNANGTIYHFFEGADLVWHRGGVIKSVYNVAGTPAMIQGLRGDIGNFELITATDEGALLHFYRANDGLKRPWGFSTLFGQELFNMAIEGVGLVENQVNGNLEVVCVADGMLIHFWRDSEDFTWSDGHAIEQDIPIVGIPSFRQIRVGDSYVLEVRVQDNEGKMLVYERRCEGVAHVREFVRA